MGVKVGNSSSMSVYVRVFIKGVWGTSRGVRSERPSQNRPHLRLKGLLCVNHHQQSLREVSQEFLPKMKSLSLAFQHMFCPEAQLSSRGQKDMKY